MRIINKETHIIVYIKSKETILFKSERKKIADGKKLWKTVKAFFSNKSSSFAKIYLIEKD